MNIAMLITLVTVISFSTLCEARSIRTKRQSGAMWQLQRRRRDLWETYKRLQIIYNRIRSEDSIKYVPTSVASDGSRSNGEGAFAMISHILGPDFPIYLDDMPTAHQQTMDRLVQGSLIPRRNAAVRQRTVQLPSVSRGASIEVINSNTNTRNLQLARSFAGNGFTLKVVTDADKVKEGGRKKNPRSVNEVIHLCGQINHELRNKSLKLRCEVFLKNES
uniref:uncharacterized protein LOC120336904 n=1 Tax=Styela clava TaxID=7725 RepID=UPI001939F9AB|nr:uncharacterized protein LOC120336904 [Styela clava]